MTVRSWVVERGPLRWIGPPMVALVVLHMAGIFPLVMALVGAAWFAVAGSFVWFVVSAWRVDTGPQGVLVVNRRGHEQRYAWSEVWCFRQRSALANHWTQLELRDGRPPVRLKATSRGQGVVQFPSQRPVAVRITQQLEQERWRYQQGMRAGR